MPPELGAVVLRAIEKRTEDRYQSAAALLSALEQTASATTQSAGSNPTLTLPMPSEQEQGGIDRTAKLADGDLADSDAGILRHRIGVVMIVGASAVILAVAVVLLYQVLLGL